MKKADEYATTIVEGNRFIPFDVRAGYGNSFLAPAMRNYFLFH